MKYMEEKKDQKHLRVYEGRSEYHLGNGELEVFKEGVTSNEAKERNKKVRNAFENGFLSNLIDSLLSGDEQANSYSISKKSEIYVNGLVDSLTSEVGRALIGLSVMQLCIKSIVKEQNIRLHKGSSNNSSFSWVEGISMRTLDKGYVTPTLRKYGLLRLNADGFMMTRSLAENYPYTQLYKAQIKGARTEWLALIEEVEKEKTSALETLKFLLSRLINAASEFSNEANSLLTQAKNYIINCIDRKSTMRILIKHSEKSDYAARLLEISMHALVQAAVESGAFGDMEVKPLSQMRSANKKHGNIGDIELLEDGQIVEAWDAKYGKSYLREEIEEIIEKLKNHNNIKKIGFVTNTKAERIEEIQKRIREIEENYLIDLKIISYEEWVDKIYNEAIDSNMISETDLSKSWLMMYCNYLAQNRRDVAPIDEPCLDWVITLKETIAEN